MRRHPVWAILAHQGRSLQWLARRTRYSESHIWAIKGGRVSVTPEFRARCADALDLPEGVLFHDDDGSRASQSVDPDGSESDRAVNVVARAEGYPTSQEVAISKTA